MQYTAQNPLFSKAFADAVANAFKTDPGAALAPALEVHLWKDETFTPTPLSLAADFAAHECDFTDYAAATGVVLTTPVNLNANAVGAIGSTVFTITTDPVVTENQVYGYWLETAGVIVLSEKLPADVIIAMSSPGDFLDLLVALPVMFPQDASE